MRSLLRLANQKREDRREVRRELWWREFLEY